MNIFKEKSITYSLALTIFFMVGCDNKIERSGIVVDELSGEPIEGVSIEVYLKNQRGDSLMKKIFTDHDGYFHIAEKRSKSLDFELNKSGYISHINSLSIESDTIRLEKNTD